MSICAGYMPSNSAREIEIINNSPDEKAVLEQLSNIEIEGWK